MTKKKDSCQAAVVGFSYNYPIGMTMTRTFHPVGQGGFFTEIFRNSSGKKFTVAYDVGSITANQKYLQNAIELVGSVDVVFLSHLHEDHINGISLLFKKNKKKKLRIIMPELTTEEQLETALYNMIASDGKFLVYDEKTLSSTFGIDDNSVITIAKSGDVPFVPESDIETISGKGVKTNVLFKEIWLYVPYNPQIKNNNSLLDEIKKSSDALIKSIVDSNDKINDEALREAFKNKKTRDELKNIYESVYGENHNSYSMSVYSGPKEPNKLEEAFLTGCGCSDIHCNELRDKETAHCLYTGDSELKTRINCRKLITYYNSWWDRIGIIQVPHHGSKNNYNTMLHKTADLEKTIFRLFVITVGLNNIYGHPSVSVINDIKKNGGCLFVITELSVPLAFKYAF